MTNNSSSSSSYQEEVTGYGLFEKVFVAHVESLRTKFPSFQNPSPSPSTAKIDDDDNSSATPPTPPLVLVDIIRKPGTQPYTRAFYAATGGAGGSRRQGSSSSSSSSLLHFNPSTVRAAIVSCGGLCPGLNNVIRELVHGLYTTYHVKEVWGITGGYNGFVNDTYQPILLTNEIVENIHHDGGTILKTSRGGLNIQQTLEFLTKRNINQLYIIGGDGTHRAAYKIHEACVTQNLNLAVAGIPKTIDNDIAFLDRTFGFHSAVEAAQVAIRTGLTEARCTLPNGIAVIKLMGRAAGFLAAFASLGSGDVDVVLVPEVPIQLKGPKGILPFLYNRVKQKQYAVIVVAEGAGVDLLEETNEIEAGSGNKILPPIAEYIRDEIKNYFELERKESVRMKFIDPSYLVRSVPANAADSLYCMQLAQNAVHGTMAGYTGFSVGLVNNQVVYIPIPQLVAESPRFMDPYGETWERVMAMTGQPDTMEMKTEDEKGDNETTTTATTDPTTGKKEEKRTNGGETSNDFPTLPEPTVH